MKYIAEIEGVIDENSGIKIVRRGRPADDPTAIPFGFHDPSRLEEPIRSDGYIYFYARLRFEGDVRVPSGADLSLRALAFAFRNYTNADPATIERVKRLLVDGVALYLQQHSGATNPKINFVK